MSKQNFDSEELVKLFHKIHQRLDWLTCAIKECCSKIPINIGDGIGLFKRLANNKWEFKSLVEGDNIIITQTNEEIIISSQATPFSCDDVNECLGISNTGESNKFLNEQGDFVTVSGFTCSDLNTCSTTNLVEGTRLYFTDERAVTALTGQNISLFTNDSGFITSSALSPYLTIASAASIYQPIGSYLTSISGLNISQLNNDSGYITESNADLKYYPLTNPNNYISNISSLDVTTALGYTPYDSTNPSGFLTSSSLTPYLLSSTAASTYQPIGSYLTTISGLNISLLNNDSNYLTSSTASSTYEPIITPGTTSQYYRGDKTFQTLDKSTVGLGNVDNTSDSSKPISTATQTALNLKANTNSVSAIKISSSTVTSPVSSVDFILSGYNYYEIRCMSVVAVTSNVGMWVRVSTDSGATFKSGASDYMYQRNIQNGATSAPAMSTADSKITFLGAGISNGATGTYYNAIVKVYDPSNASSYKNINGEFNSYRSDSIYSMGLVNGVYLSNTPINAIRIMLSSGNIASGIFELYGYN
jgi:hypothetical protein